MYNSFKKVNYIYLTHNYSERSSTIIKHVNDLELQIENLQITCYRSEDSEKFTNPEYFKNGVKNLIHTITHSHLLTDEFLNNINLMNLSTLWLNLKWHVEKDFYTIQILRNIKNWRNIKFHRTILHKTWKLSFKNVNISIHSSMHDPVVLNCKTFNWSVDINSFNTDYWFTKHKSKKYKRDWTFLHIVNSGEYSFHDFIFLNDEETKEYYDDFSEHLSTESNHIEFIIPMDRLVYVGVLK